jgi:hypothetical protein
MADSKVKKTDVKTLDELDAAMNRLYSGAGINIIAVVPTGAGFRIYYATSGATA